MRQVGVIAAPAIEALENMTERLADDHANAHRLAVGLQRIPGISIDPDSLPTNLVFFEIVQGDPAKLASRLNDRGIMGGGPQRAWRYVTHYGIDSDDIDYALDVIESTFLEYAS